MELKEFQNIVNIYKDPIQPKKDCYSIDYKKRNQYRKDIRRHRNKYTQLKPVRNANVYDT